MIEKSEEQQARLKTDAIYIENLPDAATNSMWGDPGNHKLWETSTRELASYVSNSFGEQVRRNMDYAVG